MESIDSMYLRGNQYINYKIASEQLKFIYPPIYAEERDITEESLEFLFILLTIDQIITLWEALLLERSVFLISHTNKSCLNHVCMALISLLFPFKWMHILIPILPEKSKVFLESPVPVIMGIPFKNINLNEFPYDSIVVNLDNKRIEKYQDRLPPLPPKVNQHMMKRLEKFKNKYNNIENIGKIQLADEVFNCAELYENNDNKDNPFIPLEIRDIFYEAFLIIFKNYERYFYVFNKKKDSKSDQQFDTKDFLKDNSSTEVIFYTKNLIHN